MDFLMTCTLGLEHTGFSGKDESLDNSFSWSASVTWASVLVVSIPVLAVFHLSIHILLELGFICKKVSFIWRRVHLYFCKCNNCAV